MLNFANSSIFHPKQICSVPSYGLPTCAITLKQNKNKIVRVPTSATKLKQNQNSFRLINIITIVLEICGLVFGFSIITIYIICDMLCCSLVNIYAYHSTPYE